MGDAVNYLEDGMSGEAVFYNGRAISFELPTTVVREVTYTEPAVRGAGWRLTIRQRRESFQIQSRASGASDRSALRRRSDSGVRGLFRAACSTPLRVVEGHRG